MRYRTEKGTASVRTIVGAGLAAAMLVGSLALGGCSGGGSDDSSEEPAAEEQAEEGGSEEESEEREPERTAEEAAEGYVQAIFDADGEGMWECLPPDVRDAMVDESGMSEDEVISMLEEEMESELGSSMDGMEDYVEGFTVTAVDSSDLSSSEIDDIVATYESDYDLALDVEEAAEVELELSIDLTPEGAQVLDEAGADIDDATQSLPVVAIMVDGEWYFDMTCIA